MLSALVYPGAGQFMQGRMVWGIVYALAFTIVFIITCVFAFRIIPEVFSTLTQGGELPTREEFDPLVKALIAGLGIYAANIYDTWYAWFRYKRGIPMVRHPYV